MDVDVGVSKELMLSCLIVIVGYFSIVLKVRILIEYCKGNGVVEGLGSSVSVEPTLRRVIGIVGSCGMDSSVRYP